MRIAWIVLTCGALACGGGGTSPDFVTEGPDDPGPLAARRSTSAAPGGQDPCEAGCEQMARCGLTTSSQCRSFCEFNEGTRACVACFAGISCDQLAFCSAACVL